MARNFEPGRDFETGNDNASKQTNEVICKGNDLF